jgi:uncharacterized protein (DUF2141 family)
MSKILGLVFLVVAGFVAVSAAQSGSDSPKKFTLTVVIEGVNQDGGNVGVLVFNSPKGGQMIFTSHCGMSRYPRIREQSRCGSRICRRELMQWRWRTM